MVDAMIRGSSRLFSNGCLCRRNVLRFACGVSGCCFFKKAREECYALMYNIDNGI